MKRVLLTVAATLVAVAASAVVATAPAQAAAPVLSVTCDATAGTVTASLSGQVFTAGYKVPIELRFRSRINWVKPAANSASTPAEVKVPATVAPSGDVAGGFTWQWPSPEQYLFYNHKVTVDVWDTAAGSSRFQRTADCGKDERTTVTAVCDQNSRVRTATVSGVRFDEGFRAGDFYGPLSRLEYYAETGSGYFGDPGFVGHQLSPTVLTQRTDPGAGTFTREIQRIPGSTSPQLAWVSLGVKVELFAQGGVMIGKGAASCRADFPRPAGSL